MHDLARHSGEYLSALRNIHSLRLCNIRLEHIGEDQFRTCFSAFRETLTHLSLEIVTTSIGEFVTLMDYFPNITDLQLCSFELEQDEGPVPPLSRSFRGRLHVSCSKYDPLGSSIDLLSWTWSTRSWWSPFISWAERMEERTKETRENS